jgi:hypoxanthine phosphoribosyltransferase
MIPSYETILSEILIPAPTLQKRIAELGAEISTDYAGEELLLVCILKGAVIFLTDLVRHITVPTAIDFMAISSYGAGARKSSGNVRIEMDLKVALEDRHVILVEDIIDSGNTISTVLEMLETRKPKSLKVCTLLDKAERREVVVPIHYRGFTIEDKFVFGYGLDLDEYWRNLPFIGVVKT